MDFLFGFFEKPNRLWVLFELLHGILSKIKIPVVETGIFASIL